MAGVLAGTSADHLSVDKCLRVRRPIGDVKKLLPHSHFARSEVFSYKEISIRLKNLSDSRDAKHLQLGSALMPRARFQLRWWASGSCPQPLALLARQPVLECELLAIKG